MMKPIASLAFQFVISTRHLLIRPFLRIAAILLLLALVLGSPY